MFMNDNELLLAISDMMDKKLKPINDRLKKIEITQENNIDILKKIVSDQGKILHKIV